MPTAWFVFLSALPLPTSSEDNFPFQWEANLWKRRGRGNQKDWDLLTAELSQWKCRQWFLTCYRKKTEKVNTKQRKVKCFKIAIGFSINSQTFHLGYYSLPSSCLDMPVQCHQHLTRDKRGVRRQESCCSLFWACHFHEVLQNKHFHLQDRKLMLVRLLLNESNANKNLALSWPRKEFKKINGKVKKILALWYMAQTPLPLCQWSHGPQRQYF